MSKRSRGIGAAFAGALCATAATLPVSAADPILGITTSVCTVNQLVVQTALPVSVTSAAATSYTLTSWGSCTGTASGPFVLSGGGDTVGPANCAALLSTDGQGSVTIGGISQGVDFVISGSTAAPVVIFEMQQAGAGTVIGAAVLSLSYASLQACLQPGGTTSLQYSGTSVFAL